ncbi:MAG: isoprenyl transferase [Bacteroidota bacterium]
MQDLSANSDLPKHIAVIMDGNGRWAQSKGASRIFGHRNAIKAVRDTTEYCAENGVSFLTLYAFSTENWARPKYEVDGLMTLLVATINDELPTLQKNNVRLESIGDVSKLPLDARDRLSSAKDQTHENTGLTLILALNYSGRWDMEQAIKRMLDDQMTGKLSSDDIDSATVSSYLATAGMPDPELMIRTSGEMRISNFLLWQLAYTELYFTEVLWPDFRKEHMQTAIDIYRSRERRFGKTSEQIVVG